MKKKKIRDNLNEKFTAECKNPHETYLYENI